MRITTKLVIEIESGVLLAREFYEYDGPVERACGGDALAGQKQQAATNNAQLSGEQASLANQEAGTYTPFFSNIAKNGLSFMPQLEDYSKGTVAQSFAPAQAAQQRSLAGFGDTLPSGFKQQQETNLDAQEGSAFDQNQVQNLLMNQQAKTQAASALNPAQFFSGATGANQSILGAAPVNSGGVGNFLGGALSGALNNVSYTGGSGGTAGAWTL